MNSEALQTHDQLAATYLQQLQALALELSVAMDAIAFNELPRLQESVAKQEMLCANLACIANTDSEGLRFSHRPSLIDVENVIELKIQAANIAIRELNDQYAALLKHSGRSIALLASLCRNHTGQFREACGFRPKQQTWSCEV